MAVRLPTYADILAARRRLSELACRTPLIEHPALNARTGGRVLLKAENLQRVGAFKFRGAYNKIAQVDKSAYPGGVVACSSGNHAQGVAAAATLMGLKSAIVMPADAPLLKIARTKAFGGEVVAYDRATEDRDAIARELCDTRTAAYVHPFDDLDVIAGQGTVAQELLGQAADVDHVFVPAGGGGLLAGTLVAVRASAPHVRVVGVEPAGAACLSESVAAGKPVTLERTDTICDGARAQAPGRWTFPIIRDLADDVMAVADDEVADALAVLTSAGFRAELTAALGLAGAMRARPKGTVVAIVTGSNAGDAGGHTAP
jgi:threonine dehydratase